MIPNCAATRHAHFTLDGSGPTLLVPKLDDWPDVTWKPDVNAKRVNLDTLTARKCARGRPATACCSTARC
jgi:fumarate hydratase class I